MASSLTLTPTHRTFTPSFYHLFLLLQLSFAVTSSLRPVRYSSLHGSYRPPTIYYYPITTATELCLAPTQDFLH